MQQLSRNSDKNLYFLLKNHNKEKNKKRSKSFFEINSTIVSINNQKKKIFGSTKSLMRFPSLNYQVSRPKTECDLDNLSKLIESIKENNEEKSVKTIEEENEFSLEYNIPVKSLKRIPTIDGN